MIDPALLQSVRNAIAAVGEDEFFAQLCRHPDAAEREALLAAYREAVAPARTGPVLVFASGR